MSILQSKESELRYIKRKNLDQEANLIGNSYRDIIRSYGIDVIYNKLNLDSFENFKNIISQNQILQKAYGYDLNPDFSISSYMISYMEIEQDIFQLNKYGLNPNTDVNFYFDSTDFACQLASKLGQYEEYKIKESSIEIEIPECTNEVITVTDPTTHNVLSSYISADIFPYKLGIDKKIFYECQLLSGKLSAEISGYELNKEYTIQCDPYEHTDFKIEFPANKDLYRSLKHKYKNDDYLQTLIFLTFKVQKIIVGKNIITGIEDFKYILSGKIHGAVLFYNLYKIGKYLEKIHPDVGDLITIDFPDEKNAERYQITDCYDKSLANDGISPLLHKYIWKCKARRYLNNNDINSNEADQKLLEKQLHEQIVEEEVTKKISNYSDSEDAAYGGYEGNISDFEKTVINPHQDLNLHYINDGTYLDIHIFASGSKLVTDGYQLIFVKKNKDAIKLTLDLSKNKTSFTKIIDDGLKYLKASVDCLVFIDFDGNSYKIVEDTEATQNELQICLDSLFNKTIDLEQHIAKTNSCFYIFKSSKTLLWATEDNLYCKLASNGKLYKLV